MLRHTESLSPPATSHTYKSKMSLRGIIRSIFFHLMVLRFKSILYFKTTCNDTWWWMIHPDLTRWEYPGQAIWGPGSQAAPLKQVIKVKELMKYRLNCEIKDLMTTREGACSATLTTKDCRIEEREVLEDSRQMCIKEIGEWADFLIFFKLASSSEVNARNLRGLRRGTTPCLLEINVVYIFCLRFR